MKKVLYIILVISSFNFLYSQDISFANVGDEIIYLEDFLSIYNKNRLPDDTIMDPNDIDEYLDLFIKFKLKVVEAKSLGMDTLPSFIRELDGYRRQLAKSYLNDNEVTNKLLLEAYERLKEEVNVSHILIKLDPTSSPEDTLIAFNKAKIIQNEANENDNFAQLARKYSDDPSVDKNDGELGYFTALYMLYPFENASYNTNVGDVSDPVRTRYGYHILKVNDRRDSRGEVKVSHIMISLNPKNNSDSIARKKVKEIYDLLIQGNDFESLVRQYSDDKKSAANGGELDWFGSNKMYETFEEAAFNLTDVGDFSLPIETPAGLHIIKLLDKKNLPSYEEIESSLKSRVEKDSRSQKSRDSLIKKLKQEYAFSEMGSSLDVFYNLINEDFFNNETKSSDLINGDGAVLFTLSFNQQKTNFYQNDFADFLISFKRNFRTQDNVQIIIDELYKTFLEQKILSFEDQNLEAKYNDFRLLINEYHDGILLFELMEQKVWSKAAKDTAGLALFFENNIDKYLYPERILSKHYICNDGDSHAKLVKYIRKGKTDEYILNKINKNSVLNLSIQDSVFFFEEGSPLLFKAFYQTRDLSKENLEKMNAMYQGDQGWWYDHDTWSFGFGIYRIYSLLPPTPKPFKEVKGLVISDYQKVLEDDWLNILKDKYDVVINEDLLTALKENNLNDYLIRYFSENEASNEIPIFGGSFDRAFINASNELGTGESIYFKWNGEIYTTELAP